MGKNAPNSKGYCSFEMQKIWRNIQNFRDAELQNDLQTMIYIPLFVL